MHLRILLIVCVAMAGCSDPAQRSTPRVPRPTPKVAQPTALPAHPPPDWAAELAWARDRFPELRDFTIEPDVAPLMTWVPEGSQVTLFINVKDDKHPYRCAAATAVQTEPGYLLLTVPGPERIEAGQTVRDFVHAGAQQTGVSVFYSGGKQLRRSDGSWEQIDGYATGGRDLGGYVGPVSGDTAHFRYVNVRLEPNCGPMVPVPCEGRARECNRCEDVTIDLPSARVHRRAPKTQPSNCAEPCAKVSNPDLERALRLAEHFPTGWVLQPDPLGAALYRTLEACRADPLWATASVR